MLYLATPQYESNLLVHVEEKGQREPKNILGEAGSMIDYKTPSAAEIELLRSRQVIARAVDRLKLYIEVKPKRLPIVGKVFSALGTVNYFPVLQSVGGYASCCVVAGCTNVSILSIFLGQWRYLA